MKRWARGCCVAMALIAAAAGCGGGGETVAPSLTVTFVPASITALVGSFVQFSLGVSSAVDTVTFTVNDVEGGNATVGTINTEGLYQAPATVPANTAITVKVTAGNSQTGTSASATATVTLDSGIRVSIVPAKFTIGTDETFTFVASVTGVPPTAAISGVCDNVTSLPVSCTAVTWSVSGSGTINSATGLYTAPSATGTATITAKSVYDTARTATATVTIVTATDPTLTSISNTVGAVGAFFQDIYLAGTNFISTTEVRLDGNLVTDTALVSSAVLRVRLAASNLLTAGTPLTFTASRQNGAEKGCPVSNLTPCQLVLSAVRPAVVGISPDSVPQGSSPTLNVNGGYFGPPLARVVTAEFAGQSAPPVDDPDTSVDRRLNVPVGTLNTPGLYPLTVLNESDQGAGAPRAAVNLAVQPSYPASDIDLLATLAVGTMPSAVAINTATGIAIVANQGSHDVTLINVAGASSVVVAASICTGAVGAVAPCPAAGPVGVAVDNLRNLALVANSTSQTVAVVDLGSTPPAVTAIIPSGATSIADMPMGIGINPLTGLAIVAYQTAGFASIIDLKELPYAVTGLVTALTGAKPRVAVSPKLNWALITPGGSGTLTIVDLGRPKQNENTILSASRSGGIVTITTASPHTIRAGDDPVLITGVTDLSFNGTFAVASAAVNSFTYSQSGLPDANSSGPLAKVSYARPVAQVAGIINVTGVALNDETQKAVLVDETGTQGRIFSLLDQTSSTVTGLASPGTTAAAFNPLANIAVTVNRINGNAAVIDPVAPAVLEDDTITGLDEPVDVAIDPGTNTAVIVNQSSNDVSIFSLSTMRSPQVLQISPDQAEITSTLTTPAVATDQALTIIGKGFTGSSVARLDGDSTGVQILSVSDRVMTVKVLKVRLQAGGPRRYALDVVEAGSTSNAASFTVIQHVDVSSSCSPQGVAIDSRRDLAVVTNSGCNNVALIKLKVGADQGTGETVLVGTNPQGVAVHVQSGLAVVANQGSSNASIVGVDAASSNYKVVVPVITNPEPQGVAIDQGLGRAMVTASAANVVDLFNVSATPGSVTSLAVQARPVAVAVDPDRHLVAVANTSSNTVSLVDLTGTAATEHIAASGLPAGIVFDPVSTTFLTAASLANQVLVLDPVSRSTISLRVGINPTSIAYNFASGTLVTTNSSSQTLTVVDFLDGRVRAVQGLGVLGIQPSGQFAVDIHPFSNLAVIADSANHRVVLLPLPR